MDETAWRLMLDCRGWLCWYGTATRVWWALPPSTSWCPSLLEATTPYELAARIHEVCAVVRRAA